VGLLHEYFYFCPCIGFFISNEQMKRFIIEDGSSVGGGFSAPRAISFFHVTLDDT
jgi:hypothetical protein